MFYKYFFLLILFFPVFSAQQSDFLISFTAKSVDVYKKIQFDYLDIRSIERLACTCTVLSEVFNKQLIPSMFITDKAGNYIRTKGKNRMFSLCMLGVYTSRFDLCTQLLSSFAQCYVEQVSSLALPISSPESSKESFEILYSLHKKERDEGLKTVYELSEPPSIEDCMKYYSKSYYEDQKETKNDERIEKRKVLVEQLNAFIEIKNWAAVKTIILNGVLFKFYLRCDDKNFVSIFDKVCATCVDGDIIIQILRNMDQNGDVLIFNFLDDNITQKRIPIEVVEYVYDNIGSGNEVLRFMLRNCAEKYFFQEQSKIPDLIQKYKQHILEFIKRKNINVDMPDSSGQSIVNYVLNLGNNFFIKMFISDYNKQVLMPGDDGKTLLERKGLHSKQRHSRVKENEPLISCFVDIRAGDINAIVDSKGNTLLHYYVYCLDYYAVEKLLYAGADINKKNKAGYTPLALMLTDENIKKEFDLNRLTSELKTLKLIFDSGADVCVVDNQGYSIWSLLCIGYEKLLKKQISYWNSEWNSHDAKYVCSRREQIINYYSKLMNMFIEAGTDIHTPLPNNGEVAHFCIKDAGKDEWESLIKEHGIDREYVNTYEANLKIVLPNNSDLIFKINRLLKRLVFNPCVRCSSKLYAYINGFSMYFDNLMRIKIEIPFMYNKLPHYSCALLYVGAFLYVNASAI